MSPQDSIGHYQIVAKLGEGGMGAVYRALDTKLNREVAIKILPPALAGDPDYVARFTREAQVLASLNHPNIAILHGIEDRALVMELVPGVTLAERIEAAPLPLPEALDIARQIAEALEAAHEKGVVHRDLKPANVKVTPEGVVKVLDFGLAKAAEPVSGVPANSPTLTMRATQAGLIMGTAGYMAPEQAAGKPVDRRADIWSFGVVLYEMLTGKTLFTGETVSHTLASVLKDPIDFSAPPAPAPIRRLLARCLNRDQRERLRDIGEARIAIRDYLVNPQPEVAAQAMKRSSGRSSILAWVLASLLALAAAAGWWRATRPAELRPLMRLNVELSPDGPIEPGPYRGLLALSPDGTRVAVTMRGPDHVERLYTRLLSQARLSPVSGAEDSSSPFFSPDGQWIAFVADNKLKKMPVAGGAAITLCDTRAMRGGAWGDDGNIVFAADPTGPLWRISAAGGAPTPFTRLREGERTHRWPQVLPGSQAVLFTAHNANNQYDDADIDIYVPKTGERKTLVKGGFFGRYVVTPNGSGWLVYLHQNALFGVPFDSGRLAVTGSAAPLLEGIANHPTSGSDLAFSQNGTVVYLEGNNAANDLKPYWIAASGKPQVLRDEPGIYATPRFSPDGKRLAYSLTAGTRADLWVLDLDRNTASRLTFLDNRTDYPVWMPDGKSIIFRSTTLKGQGLYWIRSDGGGEPHRLTDQPSDYPYSVSSDGKRLYFNRSGDAGSPDLYTAAIEGDREHPQLGKPELFLGTPTVEAYGRFSPDGRWLCYMSMENGTSEVYVRPFPGPGGRWQISSGGGTRPVWSSKKNELLYEGPDRRLIAVDYTAKGDSFIPGKRRVWSEIPVPELGTSIQWDLAPDGNRAVAMLPADLQLSARPLTHVVFLLNFFDELQRR